MICGKTELCVFDNAPAQTMVEHGVFVDIHPTTIIEGAGSHIEFQINGSETEYLDLNDTLLYVRLKVLLKNGTQMPAGVDIKPANYFLNSLFNDIVLTVNDTVVEGGNRLYAYKSTIESIFNFSEDTKRIQLEPSGFSKNDNVRKTWIAESRSFDLVGALRLDFFNQPKYLIPKVNVRIQLQRNKHIFSLITTGAEQPQIQIENAIIYVRRVKVNQALALGHQIGLTKQNAIYPVTKSQIVTYTVSKGSMSYYKDNVFSTIRLPKFVVVGFVKVRAFNGHYADDPFHFDHFNVNYVSLLCDGQPIPYRDSYQPDFENGLYAKEYMMSIIHNTQHYNTNMNNGITMDDFANKGLALFTFNLAPDFDMFNTQAPRDGNLRLDLKFAKPIPDAINVIVYGIFDGEMQLGKDKQVVKP